MSTDLWLCVAALAGVLVAIGALTIPARRPAHRTRAERPAGAHARTGPEPALLEPVPPSLPDKGDPFAHVDAGREPDPDGSVWAGLLARDPDGDYPPLPAPVPLLLPALPVPGLPGRPGRPVPPEDGGDDEREYRRQVNALLECMPAGEVQPGPLPAMTDVRESGATPGVRASLRPWKPPADAATLARLLGAMERWTPEHPQEPERRRAATLAELVRSAPAAAPAPPAGDIAMTGEIAFAPVMELGDVDEFIAMTFAPAEATVAATIAAELDGSGTPRPVPAPWVNEGGSSAVGLPVLSEAPGEQAS